MAAENTRMTLLAPAALTLGEARLVQILGPELGRMYPLREMPVSIGREAVNDIPVDIDSVSRQHVRLTASEGTVWVEDLGSTNGTFVNDVEVKAPTALAPGDLLQVGRSIFKFIQGAQVEEQYHEALYRLSTLDALTQLYNRRYLLEVMEREISRTRRSGRHLSLVLLDIDHFKRINDTYGHLAGDSVLKEVAATVASTTRREDVLARYGGEEFALLLPELPLAAAHEAAEKVRALIASRTFAFDGHAIPVTLSLGVCELAPHMAEPHAFIGAADAHLYKAKHGGRNRVVSG